MRNLRCGPAIAALAAAIVSTGCLRGSAQVELTSFKDPYFPESMSVRFDDARYASKPDQDMVVVARVETSDTAGEAVVRQYLSVDLFWRPAPGRSFANATATNATIRHIVASDDGVVVYSGTAFVYPEQREPKDRITFTIESASLEVESTSGEPVDIIGQSRLTAVIDAPRDDTQAARWIREIERLEARGSRTARR